MFLWYLWFFEEIRSLSHSVVFLYFFALIAEEGFLISSCYSLDLCIQMFISFLFSFAFHFSFSQLFVRPPQTAILLFCISFPWGWLLLGPCYFCPLLCPPFMKCSLGISNFLEDISSFSHCIVLIYLFALISEEGFPISPCYSLELCIQMGISFLFHYPQAVPKLINYL